jgi:hypothetical protein
MKTPSPWIATMQPGFIKVKIEFWGWDWQIFAKNNNQCCWCTKKAQQRSIWNEMKWIEKMPIIQGIQLVMLL